MQTNKKAMFTQLGRIRDVRDRDRQKRSWGRGGGTKGKQPKKNKKKKKYFVIKKVWMKVDAKKRPEK